jgi:hypothetical protein
MQTLRSKSSGEKTASKRSISCEKGHLQIFYSDDEETHTAMDQ